MTATFLLDIISIVHRLGIVYFCSQTYGQISFFETIVDDNSHLIEFGPNFNVKHQSDSQQLDPSQYKVLLYLTVLESSIHFNLSTAYYQPV